MSKLQPATRPATSDTTAAPSGRDPATSMGTFCKTSSQMSGGNPQGALRSSSTPGVADDAGKSEAGGGDEHYSWL